MFDVYIFKNIFNIINSSKAYKSSDKKKGLIFPKEDHPTDVKTGSIENITPNHQSNRPTRLSNYKCITNTPVVFSSLNYLKSV